MRVPVSFSAFALIADHLEEAGEGELRRRFEALKLRLAGEGLFDAARKRPLPVLPRKIGIVTSLDGAALRDIIKVLRRRYPNVHLVIRPARVQGEGAAEDIARGLKAVGHVPGVDVVITGRGGGWPLPQARATASSRARRLTGLTITAFMPAASAAA